MVHPGGRPACVVCTAEQGVALRTAVDFNMGEFFVARPFRRDGIGARAAIDVIEMHKGQWEIAIGERNLPAKAFWPRVVAAANVSDVETLAGDGVTWTGPILRCVARCALSVESFFPCKVEAQC